MVKLNEKENDILYIFYEETSDASYIDLQEINKKLGLKNQSRELDAAIKYLKEMYLIEGERHSGGGIFRISTDGINAVRAALENVELEKNKTKRQKLLDRCERQSPLRPFLSLIGASIAIIISIIALVVSIG